MYFAIVQYDGSMFSGWQRQPRDRTVQGEIEGALEQLTGRRIVVHAAGRTDSGVHALGQTISFDPDAPWAPEELARALNATTPRDIWIRRVGRAPSGFHARKSASSRRYRYVVGTDPGAGSPFRFRYEWAVRGPFAFSALCEAGELFLGEHDFTAFSAMGQEKPHYRCTVRVSEWRERADQEGFIFTVEADRFLHRMVRFLVGNMVDAARGRRPVEDLVRVLRSGSNRDASPPAPPHGLYFESARYPQFDLGLGP